MELDVDREALQGFQTALNDYIPRVRGAVADRDLEIIEMLQKWGNLFDYSSYLTLNYGGLDKTIIAVVQKLKSSARDSGTLQEIYTLCACITRIKCSATGSMQYAPFDEAAFIWLPMSVSAFFGTTYNSFYPEIIAQCLPEYVLNVTRGSAGKIDEMYREIIVKKSEFETKISNEFVKFNESVAGLNQLYERIDIAHAEGTFSLLATGFGRQMKSLKEAKLALLSAAVILAILIVAIPSRKLYTMDDQPAVEPADVRLSLNATQVRQSSNSTEVATSDHFVKTAGEEWKMIVPDRQSAMRILLMLSIEVILIYFFRICLVYYNRIASQIAQYDARIALCGFAPEYAKFIDGKSAEVKESFKHFEEHVMSKVDQANVVIPTALECTIPVKLPKSDSK